MSGPIVRTGATPEFWQNWDNVFGKKSKSSAKKEAPAPAEKSGKTTAVKKTVAAKPTAASASKKAAAKKTPAKTARKK